MLSKWPLPRPRKWVAYVNEPASEQELEALGAVASGGLLMAAKNGFKRRQGNLAWNQH